MDKRACMDARQQCRALKRKVKHLTALSTLNNTFGVFAAFLSVEAFRTTLNAIKPSLPGLVATYWTAVVLAIAGYLALWAVVRWRQLALQRQIDKYKAMCESLV